MKQNPNVQLIARIGAHLRYLREMGVGELRVPKRTTRPAGQPPAAREGLAEIRADLGECTRCPLHQDRRTIVFGEGNPRAELMFIGEGPGRDEDQQGRPFVGRAGQLLNQIIEAMGLRRQDVYIGNIVKCRPPNNRVPQGEEIDTCVPFIWRQVRAIGPKIVCTLGGVAAQTILQTSTPISRIRGKFQERDGLVVLPTFHPAYLLRNPAKKRQVWDDMQLIMARLGLQPRSRRSGSNPPGESS